MKFFIDTANVEEIRKANDMGIIAGVTTNPSLIAKEGRDYAETLAEIATIVDGPISGEVKATTADAEGMIAEGRAIYALDPAHMVVKIPMTAEGLKAIKVLIGRGYPHQLHADLLAPTRPCWPPAPEPLTSARFWGGWMTSASLALSWWKPSTICS